jgi:hypothetical protein
LSISPVDNVEEMGSTANSEENVIYVDCNKKWLLKMDGKIFKGSLPENMVKLILDQNGEQRYVYNSKEVYAHVFNTLSKEANFAKKKTLKSKVRELESPVEAVQRIVKKITEENNPKNAEKIGSVDISHRQP